MRTAKSLASSHLERGASREALSPHWDAVFEALAEKEICTPPERGPHAWMVNVGPVLCSGASIIGRLPGRYEHVADCWLETFDEAGAVTGYALQAAVWTCAAERASFSYVDHASGALLGVISVYQTEAAYRHALAAAVDAAVQRTALL